MNIGIVTGASSGLGRETATQLAKGGFGVDELWLIARRKERLERLAQDLSGRVSVRIFPLDITRKEALKELQQALEREKPTVRVLVNAAGFGKIGPFMDLPCEDSVGMIDLNCKALVAVTRMVLPFMGEKGRIIQYASSAAFVPQPNFAVYAATKAFVLSFSRALGEELRHRGNIKVTAVCPGPVKTEFFDIAETTGKMPSYKKLAMADEKAVVALALKDSRRGKAVSVYGGMMKSLRICSRLFPHKLILHGLSSMQKNR